MAIHPDTKLGYVSLTVSDLDRALEFYRDVLGFRVNLVENGTAQLSAGTNGSGELLRLTEKPGARAPGMATGLYHFAILVPSRFELARSLRQLAQTQTPLQGFADHLVSEAIYLADPDGNGIEIYRDRPRSEWQYDRSHNLRMATDPLDVQGVLGELVHETEPWEGLAEGTVLGHMHLKSANTKRDEAFYHEVLGFDRIFTMPSASFLSAGGYHHHLGMNTWESAGAPPPRPDTVGLNYFTVRLPTADEQNRITDRLHAAGIEPQETDQGVLVRDPSQNSVLLTTGENAVADAFGLETKRQLT